MNQSARHQAVQVCVVSAHPLVLEEFRGLLAQPEFHAQTVRMDVTVPPDLYQVRPPPALFVVDALAPVPTSAAVVSNLLDGFHNARVLAVAERLTDETGFALLRAGARGLLTYAEARQRLTEACRLVAAGDLWAPRVMLSRFLDCSCGHAGNRVPPGGPAGLSHRRQEVLAAVAENLSNKEIGDRLNISERTVKFHISRLLALYGVRHRTDLILRMLPYRTDTRALP